MRPSLAQILIIVAVAVVLFGAKKIPELARSIGKAKGEFKKGLLEGEKEEAEGSAAAKDEQPPVKEIADAK